MVRIEESLSDHMDSFYYGMMNMPDKELRDVLFEYVEEFYENHYVTENVVKKVSSGIKKFFTKLMTSMSSFIKEIQIKIEYTARQKHLKDRLKEMEEELKEREAKGEKEVDIFDFWYYKKKYLELNFSLRQLARKFTKVKYTKTWQIEDDLKKFNDKVKEYGDIMEEATKKTTHISLRKALNFVEDEIRGKSEVFKTLNDSMREFQEMQLAETMEKKLETLGSDVIPKHIGFIQQMCNGISSFVRKCVFKFVTAVVFVFA